MGHSAVASKIGTHNTSVALAVVSCGIEIAFEARCFARATNHATSCSPSAPALANVGQQGVILFVVLVEPVLTSQVFKLVSLLPIDEQRGRLVS